MQFCHQITSDCENQASEKTERVQHYSVRKLTHPEWTLDSCTGCQTLSGKEEEYISISRTLHNAFSALSSGN